MSFASPPALSASAYLIEAYAALQAATASIITEPVYRTDPSASSSIVRTMIHSVPVLHKAACPKATLPLIIAPNPLRIHPQFCTLCFSELAEEQSGITNTLMFLQTLKSILEDLQKPNTLSSRLKLYTQMSDKVIRLLIPLTKFMRDQTTFYSATVSFFKTYDKLFVSLLAVIPAEEKRSFPYNAEASSVRIILDSLTWFKGGTSVQVPPLPGVSSALSFSSLTAPRAPVVPFVYAFTSSFACGLWDLTVPSTLLSIFNPTYDGLAVCPYAIISAKDAPLTEELARTLLTFGSDGMTLYDAYICAKSI